MRPPLPALPLLLLLAAVLLADLWAAAAEPPPVLDFGHGGASALAYGLVAAWIAFLLWRRNPRARSAAYVFFTFDAVRSLRLGHPPLLALDAAAVLYLQVPAMRHLYPSMWSRARAWRRRSPV